MADKLTGLGLQQAMVAGGILPQTSAIYGKSGKKQGLFSTIRDRFNDISGQGEYSNAQRQSIPRLDLPIQRDEEIKVQEPILPQQRQRQRFRPQSESWFDQIFLSAESLNRNRDVQEEIENEQANQQAANQILSQAAEPLEEDQKQSLEDANQIANQIQSALDAEDIAEQIANSIIERNNEDFERDVRERENNGRMTDGMLGIMLSLMGRAIIFGYLNSSNQEEVKTDEMDERETIRVSEAMEDQPDDPKCRKFVWVERKLDQKFLVEEITCIQPDGKFKKKSGRKTMF